MYTKKFGFGEIFLTQYGASNLATITTTTFTHIAGGWGKEKINVICIYDINILNVCSIFSGYWIGVHLGILFSPVAFKF